MPSAEFHEPQLDHEEGQPPIHCDACQSAVAADGQGSLSFLLLDTLTVPVVSCEDHLEQFTSVCGFTTDGSADLLHHRPAGGVRCPSCRLAPHSGAQPAIPVRDGAVIVVACPEHRAEIVQRFHAGLETRRRLTTDLAADVDSRP